MFSLPAAGVLVHNGPNLSLGADLPSFLISNWMNNSTQYSVYGSRSVRMAMVRFATTFVWKMSTA